MKKMIYSFLIIVTISLLSCGDNHKTTDLNASVALADFGNLPEDPYKSEFWPAGCPDPFDLTNTYEVRFSCLSLYLSNLPDGTFIAQPYFIYTEPEPNDIPVADQPTLAKPGPGSGSTQCKNPSLEINTYAGQKGLFSNCNVCVTINVPLGGGSNPTITFGISNRRGSVNLSIDSQGKTNCGGTSSSGGLIGRRDYDSLCQFGQTTYNPACW
jgi:hypothetical protein